MEPIDQSVLEDLPPGTLVWAVDDGEDEEDHPEGHAVVLGRACDFVDEASMRHNDWKDRPLISLLFDSRPASWKDKEGYVQKSWRVMYNNDFGDSYVSKVICKGDST